MKSLKLFGYTKKRKVTTTVSDQKKTVFPDLVGRNFTADKPNQLYVGDITYLPIADHMRTSLVQDALKMAKGQRGILKDAIFHSDHGSVYTSNAFQDTCKDLGIESCRWDQSGPVRITLWRSRLTPR